MVSGIELARISPKYLGLPYSRLDCQAFVEECLSDAGIKINLPGSNSWYRECMKNGWVGTPKECLKKLGKIPEGAFLFILQKDGKEPEKYKGDGIGNASHIGIYTGMTGSQMVSIANDNDVLNADKYNYGSGAIHSSASRGCVCTSNFKGKEINGGWNRIGLWNQIDYGGGDQLQMTKAKVIDGDLNLRVSPSRNSSRIIMIPDGSVVDVEDSSGGWSKVKFGAFTGYVVSEYLEPMEDGTEMISVPMQELQKIYDTVGDWLGLRG